MLSLRDITAKRARSDRQLRRLAVLAIFAVCNVFIEGAAVNAATLRQLDFDKDGSPSGKATALLEPTSLALAANGALILSDASAQTLLQVDGKGLSVVAGSTHLEAHGQSAIGSFADGPALAAPFSRPSGVAASATGTVFVADSMNFRIRSISHGEVTTLAGGLQGVADGSGDSAKFNAPVALAAGPSALYVADWGVGIRRVDFSGRVTTLIPLKGRALFSVSVLGSEPNETIAYTDVDGLHFWTERGPEFSIAANQVLGEAFVESGTPFAVALVSSSAAFYSDARTGVIYYVHIPLKYQGSFLLRTVYGRHSDEARSEGPLSPTGLVWNPATNVLDIADPGRRKIFELQGLSTRSATSGDISALGPPTSNFRIALVGNSEVHFGVMWDESIGGQLESTLDSTLRARTGKHVTVDVVRLDGAPLGTQRDFITQVLLDDYDAVILFVNSWTVSTDVEKRPELSDSSRLREFYVETLGALGKQASGTKTHLIVVTQPVGIESSPVEREADRWAIVEFGFENHLSKLLELESIVAASGVESVAASPAILAAERTPRAANLFSSYDHHMTPAGSTLLGRWLADFVAHESWFVSQKTR